jgi:hypothetical protein
MRALRYLHLALVLLLSYTVLFSATARVGKTPYKPCLSRLTQQLKLVGVPQASRQELAATAQPSKPVSNQDTLLLFGFKGFGLRDIGTSESSLREYLTRLAQPRLEIAPQQDPFALRV